MGGVDGAVIAVPELDVDLIGVEVVIGLGDHVQDGVGLADDPNSDVVSRVQVGNKYLILNT